MVVPLLPSNRQHIFTRVRGLCTVYKSTHHHHRHCLNSYDRLHSEDGILGLDLQHGINSNGLCCILYHIYMHS